MMVPPEQVQLIANLVRLMKANKTIEIGKLFNIKRTGLRLCQNNYILTTVNTG